MCNKSLISLMGMILIVMTLSSCLLLANKPAALEDPGGGGGISRVSTPTFDLSEGTFTADQQVGISCATAGATIYYTTDGSDPTEASTVYSVPVSVSGNGTDMTIKAMAVANEMLNSTTASAEYVINYIKVATPLISPEGGAVWSGQAVTITSATSGAFIYYTTDGSTPSVSSTLYDEGNPPTVTSAETLQAIALKVGYSDSDIASAIYTLSVFSPSSVSTFAGSLSGAMGSWDGIGNAAAFAHTNGITTDGTNLYVVDDNQTIRKIVIATAAVTTFAGTGSGQVGSTDGIGPAARFYNPENITYYGGNLYVTDSYNSTIRKIVVATQEVTTIAGTALSYGHTDGIGSAARFHSPYGITTDGTNLYVADSQNNSIRKIVIATAAVTTFAGSTVGASGSNDGTGTDARFSIPRDITYYEGNLYVTDLVNQTIRKIVVSTGVVTTIAGSVGSTGHTDGIGSAARFYYPYGITTDGTNLYVTDWWNSTIRKIVISSAEVTTLAGIVFSSGEINGPLDVATFYMSEGILYTSGKLFISDYGSNCIRGIQ